MTRRAAILRATAADAGRATAPLPPRVDVVVYRQLEATPEQLAATRAAVVEWLRRLRTRPVR